MNRNQIGLQLYTVREQAGQDLAGTLRRLADMGYRLVELAGLYGHDAAEVRAMVDEVGLRAVSAHVPVGQFVSGIDDVQRELQALGRRVGADRDGQTRGGIGYSVTTSPN